ncbi:rho GTPase activating protein 44 [Trichuris trichiura]|uniref:Rho GTPase activating protein 44 n=1 Tax=Trichuris trichiura TaxID=36087 RepID=A0A077YWS1_TRITR|nr:rho GTPase activating protein 44 [Trichuris trichiura]
MENFKKHMYRVHQLAQQTVGRAERSEVRSEDLQQVEQRIEAMVDVLHRLKSKLSDSFRSRSKEDNLEKRRKKLDEYNLAVTLFNDSRQLNTTTDTNLLSPVMSTYANTLFVVMDAMVRMEIDIEKHVFESLAPFFEAEKSIVHTKEKLKRLVLDMDAARTRLSAGQSRGEKSEHIQDELANALVRVENCKDIFATEVFSLASREVEMAEVFSTLLKIQMQFYKKAYDALVNCLTAVTERIDRHPRRPVYGQSLEKHLRYSSREIALVLEVCCAALTDIGLNAEGLFRIPGNSLKVRRLKTAFDAGELDLSEFEFDPHAIAGALKQYLRELPEPLLCNNFYDEWLEAIGKEPLQERLNSIKRVLEKVPECNYKNIRYLIKFLCKVAQNHAVTKMTAQNLAIIFGPSLLWSATVDDRSVCCPKRLDKSVNFFLLICSVSLAPNSQVGLLIDCLITNSNYFFPDDIQFTSPLISSLHGRDSSGVDSDSYELTEPVNPCANEETSSTESAGQKPCPASTSASRPASGKKMKPPAPPPPTDESAPSVGIPLEEKMAGRCLFNDSSSSSSSEQQQFICYSPKSSEKNDSSSWVDLEVVTVGERSPSIISVPVPRARLSVKKEAGISKRFSVNVSSDHTESAAQLDDKAFSLDRSYVKQKRENAIKPLSSPSVASSSGNAQIGGSMENHSAVQDSGQKAIYTMPNRPPLPKKSILSKHSFSFKGNAKAYQQNLRAKDGDRVGRYESNSKLPDEGANFDVDTRKLLADQPDSGRVKLAKQETMEIDSHIYYRSKPRLPEKPKCAGPLASSTKL